MHLLSTRLMHQEIMKITQYLLDTYITVDRTNYWKKLGGIDFEKSRLGAIVLFSNNSTFSYGHVFEE